MRVVAFGSALVASGGRGAHPSQGRGGGGGSDLTGLAGHGEDNRRGRGQITSHTPGDPDGVGGFRRFLSQINIKCNKHS